MSRQAAERRGRTAETLAAWYLRFKGYRIVARRVRTPLGEIDLVARRGGTLAFVEVKARASEMELALAIDQHRLRRVAAAANALAPRFARADDAIRIDVMLLAPGRWPRHLENVWHG
ncbi:YraN family protein [Flavisphingomonas formosensis]|uniref:YraN family protein n=1 Tax=Flavisphingomonas formosensis TaxID=861534 RepID=UPI0012F7961B|nr:YraN family protein [Sphingomonas formosensis]